MGWVAKFTGNTPLIRMIINMLNGRDFIKVGTHFYKIKNCGKS